MSEINVNQLLSQLRSTELLAKGGGEAADNSNSIDFTKLLSSAINTVNDAQQKSGELAKAFEAGDPNVDITSVMMASQKAGIEFQLMVQVRNKLISAYQDIMNMQI